MTGTAISAEPAYQNVLTISPKGKAIPYGGIGVARADGQTNHGFMDLKGHPERMEDVPELCTDPALRSLVVGINAPTTGLFSVGCLSSPVQDTQGFRMTGYIEFAHNSRQVAADAASYFPAFFHFERFLQRSGFAHSVQFVWELCGADFLDAGTSGFTAVVTMNTGHFPTADGAREAWNTACRALETLLAAIPPHPDEPIYAAARPSRS